MSEGKIPLTPPSSLLGCEAGIILAALGLLIVLLSTWRFAITTRRLKSEQQETYNIISVVITGEIFIIAVFFSSTSTDLRTLREENEKKAQPFQ